MVQNLIWNLCLNRWGWVCNFILWRFINWTYKTQYWKYIITFWEEQFHIEGEIIHIRFSTGIAKESKIGLTEADILVHYAKENKIKISVYEENTNIEKI